MGLRVRTLGLKHASLRRATQLGWPGEVRRLRVDDLHQRARARRLQPGAPAVTEVARRVQGVSELRSFLGSKLRERFLLRGQTLPGLLAEWSIMDRTGCQAKHRSVCDGGSSQRIAARGASGMSTASCLHSSAAIGCCSRGWPPSPRC